MKKFVLPLLVLVAAPAMAQPESQPIAFERDGIRYVATVRTEHGVTLIAGKEVDSSLAFTLRVANGRVSGRYGQNVVNYATPTSRVD